MDEEKEFTPACPLPLSGHGVIQMAHGGGGRLMNDLLASHIRPAYGKTLLPGEHDSAVLDLEGLRLAFTTDGYTVTPLFFPGGNIGTLAVNGTVNDLLMAGAKPLFLSASFILEEGLGMDVLERVIGAMGVAAEAAGVQFVTGDTKVVDHGKADQLYITTSGIGTVPATSRICPDSIQPGDTVLVSGDIGRHGIAVMAMREGLSFETVLESDCAPLIEPVSALLNAGVKVHCLRDLTRGGLASALVELAAARGIRIAINEAALPVNESVHAACELLGLDPIHVANEGRFVAMIDPADADTALEALHACDVSANAAVIGEVQDEPAGRVVMRSQLGVERIVEMLSGEQLPRIC